MDYDFNSSLYGSDGATVATPATTASVAKSDTSYLDSFLKLVGTGATAYATVAAASAPKTTGVAVSPNDPSKTTSPVIGLPLTNAQGGLTGTMKAVLIGGGVFFLILIGMVLFKKR